MADILKNGVYQNAWQIACSTYFAVNIKPFGYYQYFHT